MAHLATFDTHKYIKELTASGFDEKQAEVIIKSILEGRDYDVSSLATKEQLAKAEARLEKQIVATREQITKVETRLEKQIATVKSDLEVTKQELKKEIEQSKDTVVMWLIGLLSPIYIGILIVLVSWLIQR